ncbi:MAG: AraC family transcriptional regulator [Rhodospirillaceae bacterium]|nr:AraC family transcriptional regulator [Rhodospirillaceae bacterium]
MRGPDWAHYVVPPAAPEIELLRAHYVAHAYERHSHDTYAIGVTEEGVQAFHYRGALHASTPGRVIVLYPGEPHDGHAGAPGGFTYRMIYIPPETVRRVLEDARDGAGAALPFTPTPVIDDPLLARRVGARHGAGADGAPRLAREALLDAVVLRLAARHAVAPPALRLARSDRGAAALRRVRDVLRDWPLEEDPAADELARLAGMSRFHLWRAFRAAYGLPPHAYRLQLRLAAAKRLLGAGEPPAAVAAALGFADQSHLSRRFKGAFGVTPGQFAAAARRAGGAG